MRNMQSNCLSMCGFIKILIISLLPSSNCLQPFSTYKGGKFNLFSWGKFSLSSNFLWSSLFQLLDLYLPLFQSCLHGEIIKLIDNARVNFFWHYPCCVMDKHFCSIKEDNHWFSVPLKSKRLLTIKYWYLLCLTSNACAQSLLALCLIIILMLLQICRILCVIFVHSDVFRPCYSVEEGGGKILSLVLFVCPFFVCQCINITMATCPNYFKVCHNFWSF